MGDKVNVDLMSQGNAVGEVASYLQSNGAVQASSLRPYIGKDGKSYITTFKGGDKTDPVNYEAIQVNSGATLRRDEWVRLDEAVIGVAEHRLGGVQDLVDANLTYDLGDGLGSTVLEYHDVSDALTAEMSMDGVTRSQNDRPEFTTHYLPLPIIHADYELNARVLAVSRALGQPLDTTLAERAARKVNEQLEKMLFTNTSYGYGGGKIHSYLNFPARNKLNLAKVWTSATGVEIVADVMKLKQLSLEDHFYGPWALYLPAEYETVIDNDYNATRGNTTRQRIMEIDGINKVKVIDTLPAGNILLVQMTSDVVRLVRGMGIQNIEWKTEGNLITKYKVMTIQVPQIRSDQNGNCGIVHMAAGLV